MTSKSYRPLADRRELSEEEWHELRLGNPPEEPHIGSSDAAGVLGVSPWESPYSLFLEKSGKAKPDGPDEDTVAPGNYFEWPIAKWAADREGWDLQKNFDVMQHPELDFMTCNVDAEIEQDGCLGVLEIKKPSIRMIEHWKNQDGDRVPDETITQVHHQIAVAGGRYDVAFVAAVIDNDLLIREVPINEDLIEDLERIEGDFVERIREDNAPDPDDPGEHLDYLHREYDLAGTVEIDSDEAREKVQQIDSLKETISELEEQKSELQSELADLAAPHLDEITPEEDESNGSVKIVMPDGDRRSFSVQSYSYFDVKKSDLKDYDPEVFDAVKSEVNVQKTQLY